MFGHSGWRLPWSGNNPAVWELANRLLWTLGREPLKNEASIYLGGCSPLLPSRPTVRRWGKSLRDERLGSSRLVFSTARERAADTRSDSAGEVVAPLRLPNSFMHRRPLTPKPCRLREPSPDGFCVGMSLSSGFTAMLSALSPRRKCFRNHRALGNRKVYLLLS